MLPQYETSAMIGRGGMGAVYKGRQPKLDRDVAIKLLPESLSDDTDERNFVARFEQEAKAMAKLDHPAIISVYDFGETSEGQLYFVMEFVEGMDIQQYLSHHGGRLPQEDALAITAHVLDALQYAHSHGIVHRDIKPANILLNREGRVKVADFGLAKKLSTDDATPALTKSNMMVGTPDFVAPESLDGKRLPDHRADLYAIGVMLYQLLTGKLPRGQFKSPSELVPTLDPRLDSIVETSLQTDPDDRYSSASEVRTAIDSIFSTPASEAGAEKEKTAEAGEARATVRRRGSRVRKPSPPSSKTPLVVGGIAVVALVAGLLWLLLGGKSDTGSEGSDLVAETFQSSTEYEGEDSGSESGAAQPTAPIKEAPQTIPGVAKKEQGPVAQEGGEEVETSPAPPEPAGEKVDEVSTPEEGKAVAKEDAAMKPVPATGDTSATVKPGPGEGPETSEPLWEIPGLESRMKAYLEAREDRVTILAAGYFEGLESRLSRAADAGDLPLAKAYREEKQAVTDLRQSLISSDEKWMEAVDALATLPPLPPDAPEALHSIRSVWIREREEITKDLDGKLQQSLAALEAELTRSREWDQAEAVRIYRESRISAGGEEEVVASTATEKEAKESGSPLERDGEDRGLPGILRMEFMSDRNPPPDLSVAEGIEDFVEVYVGKGFFVALRANGRVVSNQQAIHEADLPEFRTICLPFDHVESPHRYVGITPEGQARFFDSFHGSGKEFLEGITQPIRKVATYRDQLLVLLEDGIILWHDGTGSAEKFASPPVGAREGIEDILVGGSGKRVIQAVLTERGKVIMWDAEGEVELADNAGRGIVDIAGETDLLYYLNRDGDLFSVFVNSPQKSMKRKTDLERVNSGGLTMANLLGLTKKGTWCLARTRHHPDLLGRVLPRIATENPRQLSAYMIPSWNEEVIMWIEPVGEAQP